MSEIRFKSSLTIEEIENNFKHVNLFSGITEGLNEALSYEKSLKAALNESEVNLINNENSYNKKPALVKFIGKGNSDKFTYGKEYEAFLLEYWQGERISLHVRGDDGEITDFNDFKNFEVILDEDNVLNLFEATVECITHKFDNKLLDIKYGKCYKAIGRDKNGMYLVMDESFDCYFYPPEYFKIIEDKYSILNYCSLYCSYCS